MKATPSEEELAAIAVALRMRVTAQPVASVRVPSRWAEQARREGVRADLPPAWRG